MGESITREESRSLSLNIKCVQFTTNSAMMYVIHAQALLVRTVHIRFGSCCYISFWIAQTLALYIAHKRRHGSLFSE